MNRDSAVHFLKKYSSVLLVAVFVGLGLYVLGVSRAATGSLSLEAENGTLASNATRITDTGASNSAAVKFPTATTTPPPPPPPPAPLPPPPPPTTGTSFTIAAAGDIAGQEKEAATSTLVMNDSSILAVLMLGDGAYPDGTATDYSTKYDPTWGKFKTKTKPTPGNHEYHSSGASPYYAYFSTQLSPYTNKKYYSFNLNSWHFISLNSQEAHDSASAQVTWLKDDLQANAGMKCVLAFWHQPRFTAGTHSDDSSTKPFFDVLYANNADVVLAGHSHIYERFARSTPTGAVDNVKGIRNFVVGTGGVGLGSGGSTVGSRQYSQTSSQGILKMTLTDTSYSWKFVNISNVVMDQGSESCI